MGATNGQVLGYIGTSWGPVTPATNFTNTNVVPKGSATGLVPSLLFDDGTNVGIGTVTPGANLDVVAASPTIRLRSSGNSSSLVFVNSGGTIGSIGDPGSSEDLEVVATNRLFFNTNFATRAAIDNNGRFGIGTITPTEVVDVVGNIKFSGALLPNNLPGTAGQVLTSAGPGLPPVWSASGNFVRTSATDNLFVGTANGAVNTGSSNTFVGESSGQANTSGGQNTFVGTLAGSQNTTGLRNTFLGESAGLKNNNDFNTFLGQNAGRENVSGRANVAVGVNSMQANIAGIDQVVIGVNAMLLNTGTENTSIGGGSLRNIIASDRNTALGYHAGNAVTSGSFHTFLGESSDASAGLTNSTAIGAKAYVTQSNSMVLGSINGVNGATSNTNVGIGTSAPTEALHVVGNIRFSGALLPNNDAGAAGQVLISAGPGLVPTWGTVGAALINNTGTRNLFAGSGVSTASTDNAIFGSSAGAANTGPYNVIVGTYAARLKTTGSLNTIVGWAAGENSSANGNTFIGAEAGRAATTLNVSTFVGEKAGLAISTGTSNIMIGNSAGSATTSGNYNVFLGNNSGDTNLTGSSLTLLGRNTDVVGTALTNATAIGADATVSANNALVLGSNANVGIGLTAPATKLHVVNTASASFAVTTDSDFAGGTAGLIRFMRQGALVGSITENAGVVSYSAFTGSHYASISDSVEQGELVTLTGLNKTVLNDGGEIVYGVIPSSTPNDPKVLGSYLSPLVGTEIHQVMAVGNGEVWVVNNGSDLAIGDYLISSTVEGHAMKEDGTYEIAFVFARVAEPVQWDAISETVDGVKHARVSVFYESFVKNNKADRLEKEMNEMKSDIEYLKKLIGAEARIPSSN
jgi:hypothetical protein